MLPANAHCRLNCQAFAILRKDLPHGKRLVFVDVPATNGYFSDVFYSILKVGIINR
jgi:hypothetical protein